VRVRILQAFEVLAPPSSTGIEMRRSRRLIPAPTGRGVTMRPRAARWVGQNEAAMERA